MVKSEGEMTWKDIEIVDGPTKAPVAVISDRVKSLLPGAEIAISISHTDKQAVAIAFVERR